MYIIYWNSRDKLGIPNTKLLLLFYFLHSTFVNVLTLTSYLVITFEPFCLSDWNSFLVYASCECCAAMFGLHYEQNIADTFIAFLKPVNSNHQPKWKLAVRWSLMNIYWSCQNKKTQKSFNSKRNNTAAILTQPLPRNSFEKSIQKCKFVPKLINY